MTYIQRLADPASIIQAAVPATVLTALAETTNGLDKATNAMAELIDGRGGPRGGMLKQAPPVQPIGKSSPWRPKPTTMRPAIPSLWSHELDRTTSGDAGGSIRQGCVLILKKLLANAGAVFRPGGYHVRVRNNGGVEEEWEWVGQPISDARYELGCLRDFFLGAILYNATTRGGADAQAPLSAYLPELSLSPVGEGVRLAHIGSHSMGVYAPPRALERWADLAQFLRGAELAFPPGAVVNYGPLEGYILAQLVKRIAGASLIDVVTKDLVKPAGATQIEWGRMGHRVTLRASLEDVERITGYIFGSEFADGRFAIALDRDRVALVQRKEAESSLHPTGYAWGAASFKGSFWGHNGVAEEYSLGFRTTTDSSFYLAVAAIGHELRREWIIDYLRSAYGRPAEQSLGVLGAVRGVEHGQLSGIYEAHSGERCIVELDTGGNLHCRFFRSDQVVGSLRGYLEPSGVIIGDSRLPAHRVEFFPHPTKHSACMIRGVTAYRLL